MDVLLLLVMIAILVGVFCVAIGKGGELAYEQADHAPLDLGPVSATDVAMLRPPTALWGYNMQVTDEALDAIARALRERDIEIAYLQRQFADLTRGASRAAAVVPDAEELDAQEPYAEKPYAEELDAQEPYAEKPEAEERGALGPGAGPGPGPGAVGPESTEVPATAEGEEAEEQGW